MQRLFIKLRELEEKTEKKLFHYPVY